MRCCVGGGFKVVGVPYLISGCACCGFECIGCVFGLILGGLGCLRLVAWCGCNGCLGVW